MGHCCCHIEYNGPWYLYPQLRNALLAGALVLINVILLSLSVIDGWLGLPLFGIAILLGGYHWAREGVEELFHHQRIGIEFLMIAATAGAIILGLFDEAAILVVLYGIAEGIEEYTIAKTHSSIRELLKLAPKEARVIRDGRETTIPAGELLPGDRFVVRPGEAIPTDGIIISGSSDVDEAAVTGESLPVHRSFGDLVYAATGNHTGMLTVEVTAPCSDNSIARMIHLVQEAQERKGRTQRFIERFGERYTPLVFIGAILLVIVPGTLGYGWDEYLYRAIVLLIAAAPCALVISTPVAIAAGIGTAGRRGLLIKGGIHLENLGSISAVAFDKTGTLTTGTPGITDIISFTKSEEEILRYAASVESCSIHPLARAIQKAASDHRYALFEITDDCITNGAGVHAVIGGERISVGRPDIFPVTPIQISLIDTLRREGKTVVLVGTGEEVYGAIALRDNLRPEAQAAFEELRKMGIAVIMLTGDTAETADAVASPLGIAEVRSGLLPEEKIAEIRRLKKRYGGVAMVGDGINDAPALAEATVGIAMGAIGSDVAIEAADVALMADDLGGIPDAIRYGKRSRSIIRQNIIFSCLVLGLMIPAAALGIMSVSVAVILHEASELLAVANGLRMAELST
ncbi:MAG: Heavy metal translocating P-type ATPase [Methanocalculus sp. 52_23]|nr:MAG: Heavy metal translocating P-type ATPase [Methanocalculus sp. 52_23]